MGRSCLPSKKKKHKRMMAWRSITLAQTTTVCKVLQYLGYQNARKRRVFQLLAAFPRKLWKPWRPVLPEGKRDLTFAGAVIGGAASVKARSAPRLAVHAALISSRQV